MGEINAPWTEAQVAQLNRFQAGGHMHPFTCGRREQHPGNEGVLIAGHNGWRCPVSGCSYWQGWAHEQMASQTFNDSLGQWSNALAGHAD